MRGRDEGAARLRFRSMLCLIITSRIRGNRGRFGGS